MLSRRQLRIKVMEALYAYHSHDMPDKKAQYEELTSVFTHILDLYYNQLALLIELRAAVGSTLDRGKLKHIPTEEDINPNMRFVNNAILISLREDKQLKKLLEKKKIKWDDVDLIGKTVRAIKQSHEYSEYLALNESSFDVDRKYLKQIFKRRVMENELLDNYYSEGNLYWAANIDIANRLVLDTIDDCKRSSVSSSKALSPVITELLTIDEEKFVQRLFELTIKHDLEFEKRIADKAKNWETDRMAVMDTLLMKMAMCEILEFPVIPIKVSMNEYIEISKSYSAQESKGFINGILDNIVSDLKKEKKIKKKGKGLMES